MEQNCQLKKVIQRFYREFTQTILQLNIRDRLELNAGPASFGTQASRRRTAAKHDPEVQRVVEALHRKGR